MRIARFYKLSSLACVAIALAAFCSPSVEKQLLIAFDLFQASRAEALIRGGCLYESSSRNGYAANSPLSDFVRLQFACVDGPQHVVVSADSADRIADGISKAGR